MPEATPQLLLGLALAGCAAALASVLLVADSDVLAAPLANGAFRAIAVASWIGVGLQTWRLRPDSGLGPLLVLGGFAFAATSPMALAAPAVSTLGRLAWVGFAAVLAYVLLAFPHGRIESARTAAVFRAALATVAALWALLLLSGSELPIGGVLTRCDGACPANPYGLFTLGDGVAAALSDVATVATSALILGVAISLAQRMRTVRGRERDALTIPFACLLVFAVAVAVSNALRTESDGDQVALALGWAGAAAGLLVPWSLLVGQVRGRLIASTLLERRNAALERELRSTARELRASRARIFAAGAQERRRIERDLHDGGQNRLVALRIKLGLAADQARAAGEEELHEELVELAEEAQEALDAVRAIAHGIYPPLLATRGLGAALAAEAHEALLTVDVLGGTEVRRSTPDAEAAIWFCCMEAIQNACKHAGAGAHVTVRLACASGRIAFAVEDDGDGVRPETLAAGEGLTHMRDRVAAVGGTLDVTSEPGAGTCVRGSAPWPRRESGGAPYQGDFA